MATNGHRHSGSVSQFQNHKAQLASAYNELGKELSSHKLRVVGNYTLGKVIGEGTYGKVRMGVHRLTGTRVAIKQIPKAMSASLTREIHHHRQLHHPHVTQLYEVIATESSIWLVTELCSGGELFDYLAEKGRLGEDETRTFFGQLCLAMAYVHEKGIVHRDLKLENVLLDERCRVKLGDFGFTREFEKGSLLETFCGTTGYASPEMLLAKRYLGPEVDIWSLGVILYTLLTGTLPFDDDDDSVMRDKVIQGEFEDPEWLSDEVRDLIKNVLVVDPTKRLSIAQILAHSWFTVVNSIPPPNFAPSSRPPSPLPPQPPSSSLDSQLPSVSISSQASDSTFHSASAEFPSTPTTPDESTPDDVFTAVSHRTSESTLKKTPNSTHEQSQSHPETVQEESHLVVEPSSSRASLSRGTSTSNISSNSKNPPAYPTRTPARTKRRSVSSTLSETTSPTFEKSNSPSSPQDFSFLLSTPAPIIFSTSLERELLNNLCSLGFDTGQIVHSVLTDACDATGSLWWMLKRKAERKAAEDAPPKAEAVVERAESTEEIKVEPSHANGDNQKETKPRSLGRSSHEPIKANIPPALIPAKSAPELQFIPPTPTVATTIRPTTPPRSKSPTNLLLSPASSSSGLELSSRSHPSTPSGSLRDKDKDKDHQGSKGRKNRSGSVSIMQRATTALEAAGLVRKKSAEAVREEKEREREKSSEKRVGSGDEPRASHGSGSKLAKSPPLRAVKDTSVPSTPPPSLDGNPPGHVGSPWILANLKHSPPPTPVNSPGDTLAALPNIGEHGGKLHSNRNRASLLSAFRMWFREDPKGKRKETPALATQGLPYNSNLNNPVTSPVTGRGRGTIKQRANGNHGKLATGRKTGHRSKRASVSSRRSSSVNSRRSSVTSQMAIMDSAQVSDSMTPMTRQRSDPSRRSFGSRTPNSEREDYVSRPSSIQSFHHHRHRKSPSASSAGSIHPARTSSPLPKYHRRGGSSSSTRVIRQAQPSSIHKQSHLRSNSTSSNHSLSSSRHNSLYELSESEGRRTGSPLKTPSRSSFDDTPRRATHGPSTFVAQKRQTPFSNPGGSNYLNSIGRSSWKKSWGMEPPGWQTRSAHPAAIEVLAISPAPDGSTGIRDVFTGRHSLNMGDESDWVDEDDDIPAGYAGGLGQMPTSASTTNSLASLESPLLSPSPRGAMTMLQNRAPPPKRAGGLTAGNTTGRGARGKTGGRSPAGRSSPLPNESSFDAPDTRGGRRQLPPGRSGGAFRQAIQEEDEDEE